MPTRSASDEVIFQSTIPASRGKLERDDSTGVVFSGSSGIIFLELNKDQL